MGQSFSSRAAEAAHPAARAKSGAIGISVLRSGVTGSRCGFCAFFVTFALCCLIDLGQQVASSQAATAPASGLPDHRAYEQVSPTVKNGFNVTGEVAQIAASTDGEAMAFLASGGIPGADGAQEFPMYLARRGGAGWTTKGMLPPTAEGATVANVVGWSPTFSQEFVTFSGSFYEPFTLRRVSAGGGPVSEIEIGENFPYYVGSSEDGEVAVFESKEAWPGTAAVQGSPNVYAWDPTTGKVSLVGVANDGTPAARKGTFAGAYNWFGQTTREGGAEARFYTQQRHVVSATGDAVVFTTKPTHPSARYESEAQVYVRLNPTAEQSALAGGECTEAARACTVEVSASQRSTTDPNGEMPAQFQYASADGSEVFFTSAGKLTDNATTGIADEGSDLYRYEVANGTLTDLTPDDESVDPDGAEVRGILGASEDGSYLYFAANGVLGDAATSGASRGNCTQGYRGSEAASCNLYVWHDDTISYITSLGRGQEEGGSGNGTNTGDMWDWAAGKVGSQAGSKPSTARVTPDGRVLVFRSREQLTGYENDGVPEFYRYEFGRPGVDCVTCAPSSARATGAPTLSKIIAPGVFSPTPLQTQMSRNLSTSGDVFFFESPQALVSADTNGTTDVYEWEAAGSGSCTEAASAYVAQDGGCLYLISTGTSPQPSYFGDAGEDGSDAFFYTAQPLVAQDRDELVDIYDAREGGGIAAQDASEPEPCLGSGCKGAPQAIPLQQAPRNAVPADAGNVSPLRCRKGLVARRNKCVRKKRHKRHRKHAHAKKGKHKRKSTSKKTAGRRLSKGGSR